MNKAIFKAGPNKGSFIRSTLAPVNDRRDDRLGFMDVTLLVTLVGGGLALMRFFLAH